MNEMTKKILLVGGGGHCKSVLDSLINTHQYSEIAVVDKPSKVNEKVLYAPIIGGDEDLERLYYAGFKYAFVSVGSIGDTSLRRKLMETIEAIGFVMPNIIDPTAIISPYVDLAQGIFIGKRSVVNVGSVINKGAIINTAAIIEHDCVIEKLTHISPGAVLNGGVHVGAYTYIGANSVVKQQVAIGSNVIIGMGSVVLNDIENNVVAYGNPCMKVSK